MLFKIVSLSITDEATSLLGELSETVAIQQPTMNWHGVQFNRIPSANRAMVGSSSESDNPIHLVTLNWKDMSLFMMETPVTQASYKTITGNNPSNFDGDRNPVEKVTWSNAVEYAKQLSLQSNDISNEVKDMIRPLKATAYLKLAFDHPEYKLFRLPSESEWEFAARGQANGSKENYPWGNTIDDIDTYAQTSRKRELLGTQPVGLLKPNGLD